MRRDGDDAIGDARHRAFGAKKEPSVWLKYPSSTCP
jgi:hypothetical protein